MSDRPSSPAHVPAGAPLRFLLAGGINTAATLVLYLVLLWFVSHAVAYTVAFVTGIVISYVLNRTFVFRAAGDLGAMLLFPMVYAVQYVVGLGVVLAWVDVLGLPPSLASIAAVIVTIPLTYVLSRWVFVKRRVRSASADDPVLEADR